MNVIEAAFVIADRGSGPVGRLRKEVRALGRDAQRSGRALDDFGGPRVAQDIDRAAANVRGLRSELHAMPSGAGPAERALSGLDRGVVSAGRGAQRSSTYFSMVTDRTKLMGAAAVVALPVVQALGGATVALGGSLMGAGLGAGAVGLAGGGVLAAGLGSVVSVAKPAMTALKTATEAQDAYNDAVREHGRLSKEAAAAAKVRDRAFADQPGLHRVTREIGSLRRDWQHLTAPGRRQWFGLLGDAAAVGRRAAPRMAANANLATGAVRDASVRQARFLAGDVMQDTVSTLTHEFARDLPVAEHTLENVEVTMARLASASVPFLHEGVEFVEQATAGWRSSTKDADALHRTVGGYVDDLKAWGHVAGSGLELAKDVLMGGRPHGRTMVRDLDETFTRWDGWVRTHRPEVDHFFREAAHDTEVMAGGMADFAVGLHHLATELRPLIGPLSGVVSLAGGALGTLPPGVLASMWLGGRRLRNSRAQAPMVAGPGVMPTTPAAGGGPASMLPWLWGGGRGAPAAVRGGLTMAERAQRFGWARSMAGETALFGGPGIGGMAAGLRAASRGLPRAAALRGLGALRGFSGPMLALMAGSEFMLTPGTFGERSSNALTLGGLLGDRVLTGAERRDQATTQADRFGDVASVDHQIGHLRRTLADPDRKMGTARRFVAGSDDKFLGIGLGGDKITDQRRALAEQELADLIKRRSVLAREERTERRELRHARDVDANQRSREHGQELAASFGHAFTLYDDRFGAQEAMRRTVDGVYSSMRQMRRTGATILGENTLAWAREQARRNPALTAEVDRLARRIEHRFSRMGDRVRVVNNQILTGSRNQWRTIAAAIVDPATQAVSEASAEFRVLRAQAVAQLELMGFSHTDALAVFKAVRSGSLSGAAVNRRTGTDQSRLASDANKARDRGYKKPIGDGPGTASPAPTLSSPRAAPQRDSAPSFSLALPSLSSSLTIEHHHHHYAGPSAPITRAAAHFSPDTRGPGLLRVPLALEPHPMAVRSSTVHATPWEPLSAPLAAVRGPDPSQGLDAVTRRSYASAHAALSARPGLTTAAPLRPPPAHLAGVPGTATRTLSPRIDVDGSDPAQMRTQLRRQLHASVEELIEVVMDSMPADEPPLSLVS